MLAPLIELNLFGAPGRGGRRLGGARELDAEVWLACLAEPFAAPIMD